MIGFYVHHHGRGHVTRAAAILRHLEQPATVLTSAEPDPAELGHAEVLPLPLDVHPGPTPEALHYAPLGSPGLRRRMALIAGWADRTAARLLVVDVSVEVAVLGRLLGLQVVVVRQHGDRTDPPHRLAYGMACSLLAPYPESLEDPAAEPAIRERTHYTGLFSRFDGRALTRAEARRQVGAGPDERLVVVLGGAGGPGPQLAAVRAAAAATPGWRWLLLGQEADDPVAAGWTADPFPYLRAADVVVAAGGHNAVAEAVAADRPLVCIPEERPFGEQRAKAEALRRVGAAVVADRWPGGGEWPTLLGRAQALPEGPRRRLADGGGARRAAAHLAELART